MHQERYYLSAIENCDSLKYGRLDGMYLDADPQGYSLRNYKNYLLFGCTNHRTGDYKPKDAYTKLEAGVKRWYPEAKIKYLWSNQDCMTPDSIPYIGKYSVITPNIYVATGFNQWGMSSSMVSAMIISDMILGRRNSYHKVFIPTRLMFSGSKKMLKDTGIITNSLLSEYMKVPHDKLDDIGVGEAGSLTVMDRNTVFIGKALINTILSPRNASLRLQSRVESERADLGLPLPWLAFRLPWQIDQ
jgi:hypothetical protein